MNSKKWQETKRLYEAVTELPPDEQRTFLIHSCTDEEIRADVERMLDNQARLPPDFLEKLPLDGIANNSDEVTEAVGRKVGAYVLSREIGRGGMGVVYLAARDSQDFHKDVAIKLLWPGFPGDKERFQRERQLLANLNHPAIARLLDGGVTAEGWQYIVMDYIEGQPITEYCDRKQHSITERLRLFRDVCAVVQYAHQNLVIHRDLKPGNILVTEAGAVKLLDFGIAKLINPEDQSTFLYSVPGSWMMTPEYASPEQLAERSVSTVSDVYSLGVVLYELLTGHRPYRFTNRSPDAAALVVAEAEPELPSKIVLRPMRDESSVGTPEEIKAGREGHLKKLSNRLRGDLDNIALMALYREPEKRYQSVAQLSDDITKHLAGEPVLARKPTLVYRADRFTRRHKAGVFTALVILLTLVAGLITVLVRNQRVEAEVRRNQRLLYAANMRQAGQEWADGNMYRMGELLDQYKPGVTGSEALRGFEWYCLWNLLHRESLILQHRSWVYAATFSKDGQTIYTHTIEEGTGVWDVRTGKARSGSEPQGLREISPDSQQLLTRVLSQLKIPGATYSSTLLPDETLVATGGDDKTLRWWDPISLRLIQANSFDGWLRKLAFSPDGKLLAVGGDNGILRIWDVNSRREIASLDDPNRANGFHALAFDPKGKLLYTGGRDGGIRVWDVARRKLLREFSGHTDLVDGLAVSTDGQLLATSGDDSALRLWDAVTGQLITFVKNEGPISNVVFSPDQKLLAGACMRQMRVKVWEVAKLIAPVRTITTDDKIESIAFSPDGKTIAAGQAHGALRLWESSTGKPVADFDQSARKIPFIVIAPDGKVIAGDHPSSITSFRNAPSGQVIRTLVSHHPFEGAAAFSPDGQTLAMTDADNVMKLWKLEPWQEQLSLKAGIVNAVAFSSDGKWLATGGQDKIIRIWDKATGNELAALRGHLARVDAVRFSPDGRMLASGSWDYSVRLWDVPTGRELHILKGHGNKVNAVAFSPDGQRLASGSDDYTVRLWDVATGIEMLALKDHTHNVYDVVFSPDGQILASGSWDKTLRLWRTAMGEVATQMSR